MRIRCTVYVINITEPSDIQNPYTKHCKIALAGSIISWALTAISAGAMGDELAESTIIPVIGPFITMARVESDPDMEYLDGGEGLLIMSSIVQAVFFGYLLRLAIQDHTYNTSKLSFAPDPRLRVGLPSVIGSRCPSPLEPHVEFPVWRRRNDHGHRPLR